MDEEKSPARAGIQTLDLLISRCVFYHCATIAAQENVVRLISYYSEAERTRLLKPSWLWSLCTRLANS